jgi:hypothetical protein
MKSLFSTFVCFFPLRALPFGSGADPLFWFGGSRTLGCSSSRGGLPKHDGLSVRSRSPETTYTCHGAAPRALSVDVRTYVRTYTFVRTFGDVFGGSVVVGEGGPAKMIVCCALGQPGMLRVRRPTSRIGAVASATS